MPSLGDRSSFSGTQNRVDAESGAWSNSENVSAHDAPAWFGNRLAASEQPKIYAALHARIPMTTPDDQRAIQEENVKDDERFWDALRDLGESMIEGHKKLIAAAETKNANIALLGGGLDRKG
jgi:hypothetical protein